jgi:ribosomal protein S18 acetylase RimI-like enzyme
MIEIVSAQSGAALEHLLALSQEYVTWMVAQFRAHYPELDSNELVAEHDYEDVRKKYPGDHVPPDGCLLIAVQDNQACGCIALGRLTPTICEMRTLYVKPAFRGSGVGRMLAEASLDAARKFGYSTVRLDTLAFMEGAQKLYRSMGFYDIPPYLDMSSSLKEHICFFELVLPA